MSQISYGRQTDILDPEVARDTHVTIVGLGTVGSNAAVELAKMGVGSMHLIDGDVVESHNLPSQRYLVSDLGREKATALADRVREVNDFVNVNAEVAMLAGGEVFEDGPVILAVDDMEVRKNVLELSVAYRPNHPLVIDGRMGGKMMQVLAFDGSDTSAVDWWMSQHYFPQDQAHPIPCGGRTVSFVGAYMGGLIASYVCLHLSGLEPPRYFQTDLDTFQAMVLQQPSAATA
jgi:molybdopterin/thiamine biosynthesis adenylyltransferase